MGRFFNINLKGKNFRRRLPLIHPERPRFTFNRPKNAEAELLRVQAENATDVQTAVIEKASPPLVSKPRQCALCGWEPRKKTKGVAASLLRHRKKQHLDLAKVPA